MPAKVADAYKSASQRTRVVTEAWGEDNLYCPNCSSPRLERLAHNTEASDFSCPNCGFQYQLKSQKSAFRGSITDGAYWTMMEAIRSDRAPNYYFLHYALPDWTIRNLLLVPKFAFPESAIIRRRALASTARRAGWVGCNFELSRIPLDARIEIVREQVVLPPALVREEFRKVKSAFAELPASVRGWTLDVLNVVRRIQTQRGAHVPPRTVFGVLAEHVPGGHQASGLEFSNEDVYEFERELSWLHQENRNIRAKIRQQLQVLRNRGLLEHVGRNRWRTI
jgi:type II restriction enzyme